MKRIGIICPSEIAFRRFMPALQKCADLKYVGIACSSAEEWFGEALAETDPTSIAEVKEREWGKALNFQTVYGGEIFDGYETLIKAMRLMPYIFLFLLRCIINGQSLH